MSNIQAIASARLWYLMSLTIKLRRKKRSHLIQNAIAPFTFAENCV
ncbi:hypothetical protein QUA54_04015 [Microcoleus sp. MOSTC5]